MDTPFTPLLTAMEAAELLSVSHMTVRRMVACGRLDGFRVRGQLRVRTASVLELLGQGARELAAPSVRSLTIAQLAARWRVSVRTVRRMELPLIEVRRQRRILATDVVAFERLEQ